MKEHQKIPLQESQIQISLSEPYKGKGKGHTNILLHKQEGK
jgi:hypothetical protein